MRNGTLILDSSAARIQILPIILVTSFIVILVREPVHKHAWYLILMSPFFFLKSYLFIRERAQEGGGSEGEADSLLSREPSAGLSPGLWDHDLG